MNGDNENKNDSSEEDITIDPYSPITFLFVWFILEGIYKLKT